MPNAHLFFVCLYVKRFRVLICQQGGTSQCTATKNLRRELSKLVSDHVFCYPHVVVYLAIVYLKDEPHKVGQYCGTSRLCLNRWCPFTWLRSNDWQTSQLSVYAQEKSSRSWVIRRWEGGVRNNAVLQVRVSAASGLDGAIIKYSPFHTDRASSAAVDLISSLCRTSTMGMFFRLTSSGRGKRDGLTRSHDRAWQSRCFAQAAVAPRPITATDARPSFDLHSRSSRIRVGTSAFPFARLSMSPLLGTCSLPFTHRPASCRLNKVQHRAHAN